VPLVAHIRRITRDARHLRGDHCDHRGSASRFGFLRHLSSLRIARNAALASSRLSATPPLGPCEARAALLDHFGGISQVWGKEPEPNTAQFGRRPAHRELRRPTAAHNAKEERRFRKP
jgi:hypothetical protein